MTRKDALIDLLIHDLTGPLSICSTSIHSLLSREDKYGPYQNAHKESLRRIQRNTEKARILLQEMVEVYRSEEGLFKKETFLVDEVLRDAVRDAIEVLKPDIAEALCKVSNRNEFDAVLKENHIYLTVSGKYSVEPFTHDQKKVAQVIRNLFSNALKYRKESVKILVEGERDLVVSVEDDGSGIPVERHKSVFNRFCAPKGNSGAPEGLGFGLSCVKNIIETMGGEISLKSGSETGSCFMVRIPPLQ